MSRVLVGTQSGCRVFSEGLEGETELAGRRIEALSAESGGRCLAVVGSREIWRRDAGGRWLQVATVDIDLQSVVSVGGDILAGSMADGAVILRISSGGQAERLAGFDHVDGRDQWFAGGPPLGVRSLAGLADGSAILAAVHVGGIPRTVDAGASWIPTIPIIFDAHEVCAHPTVPGVAVAACAVGLCVSEDGGRSWRLVAEGLEITNSLAVAMSGDEALFSIQDGPFPKRSQLWRWRLGGKRPEQVRDGLPEWLEGKVDTGGIAAGEGGAALVDGGGNLWISRAGSTAWERVATGLGYAFGVVIL